ncbi:MAG: nitric oxide reductase activation protein [bacterium]|nr:MAG: nitric oxide reductase activation protein [bacterium]
MDGQIKSTLQKHLKGITSATLDNIMVKLHLIPPDRILLVLDLATSLAAISLRSSIEFLMVIPEVARVLGQSELRAWGEIGKRLASTNPDAAIEFAPGFLLRCLTLVSRQAALSTSLALDCFKSFPEILARFNDTTITARVLNLCYEVSQHSVKHSCDLLRSAPQVINHLQLFTSQDHRLVNQMLELTTAFVHRSGGTAAEFFTSITEVLTPHTQPAWSKLFEYTYTFLDKSGGVALQYFRAAGKILSLADTQAFERWTELSLLVVAQGNATGYHFLKISPRIFIALARYGDIQRNAYALNQVLDIVIQISNTSANSAVECFKASPGALRQASLEQFREWALHGLELYGKDNRRAQAYYGLESNRSRQALYNREGGLSLESISQTLRLYIEGLTGKEMLIKPISETTHEFKIGDGRTILLPAVITEFGDEASNFKLYKALAAHAAGQVEFPNVTFARRIFTTLENGRIDRKLRQMYRGLRRDLDFVKDRLISTRPDFNQLSRNLIPFEMLFQEAILGGISPIAKDLYPNLAQEIELTFDRYITANSMVGDTLIGTLKIYKFLERINEPEQIEKQSEKDTENNSEQDENDVGGEAAESENQPNQRANSKNLSEPFSYWSPSLEPIVNPADEILASLNPETDVPEQGLELGDKAFFYDEWDRDLGDYRTTWCRVIERRNAFGNRSFVDGVKGRYSGIISSVRHQFQLLRPENLRKIIGELDGEDYDLQALIDYAIDRRSSGLVSERVYIRKLRRQRDVVVSFLLDMSSSTARTISRYPSQPYSKPGQRIIDIEKEGLVLMSEALEAVGDGYSIQGFTSEGRRNVKFYVIKDFNELYSEEVAKRIGGITYQNNTRLGAAIRHATARLEKQDARTKLLIILSDGRPYDHDYGDSRYAREDTKIALRQAKINNITPFCITIDRESEEQLRDLYGEIGYTIIDNVLSLPERLPGIYRRLTT